MPRIGLGVFRAGPQEAYAAVRSALEAGYRHVDTAPVYRNEAAVGQAVRRSPAQMRPRWGLRQRLVVLPKSTRPERIRGNLALHDFALDTAQMAALDALEENLATGWNPQNVA